MGTSFYAGEGGIWACAKTPTVPSYPKSLSQESKSRTSARGVRFPRRASARSLARWQERSDSAAGRARSGCGKSILFLSPRISIMRRNGCSCPGGVCDWSCNASWTKDSAPIPEEPRAAAQQTSAAEMKVRLCSKCVYKPEDIPHAYDAKATKLCCEDCPERSGIAAAAVYPQGYPDPEYRVKCRVWHRAWKQRRAAEMSSVLWYY
jgi:hypothetical protein